MHDARIHKKAENCIQEYCYDSYDQWFGSHQTNIFSSQGKCAIKEPKEFQDDGLQIHGHTYEGKYEIYNSYFIFQGYQVIYYVFGQSHVLGSITCFAVCTQTCTKHVLWYLLGTSVCGLIYVLISKIKFQRYMKSDQYSD